MTKEQLESLWKHLMELDISVGVPMSVMSEIYDGIQKHCNENNIDFESLNIEY